MLWWVLTTTLVLIGVYLIVRPTLAALPQLKAFYAEADTFWQKLSALAWHSATVAWSYLLFAIGWIFDQLDSIATLLGDPNFKEQISTMLGADTKTLGYTMVGISLVIFVARIRSMARG